MERKYVITIGRQLGSGGRIIGEKLASKLGISFYDKELIQIASQEADWEGNSLNGLMRKGRTVFSEDCSVLRGTIAEEPFSTYYLNNETLFKIQSDVIRRLAEKSSCLFVGRCADYVLSGHPFMLNVFITADLDDRVKRISEREKLTPAKARDYIEKADKKRAAYYNYFSSKPWGMADSYHLCINSSWLGLEATVESICSFALKRFGL